MSVYYNENDQGAAQWLRNLMSRRLIEAGDIDERSITEVSPADLRGYRQVHMFAGIGGWAYATALAGWPRDKELWTASCPCQPFSSAGHKRGTRDARHLWPELARLVAANRPACLVGEQTSSALGYAWFDGVATDLEGAGYTCRAVDIPSLAVGAPHRRQRLWWVAVQPDRRCPHHISLANASGVGGDVQVGETQRRIVATGAAAPHDGPWSRTAVIACADGRPRRAKSGLRWMVDGLPRGMVGVRPNDVHAPEAARYVNRAALWRGFGGAVVPQLAAEILRALFEPPE